MNMSNGIPSDLLVAGVTFLIWAGIFYYLLRIEGKIKELKRTVIDEPE